MCTGTAPAVQSRLIGDTVIDGITITDGDRLAAWTVLGGWAPDQSDDQQAQIVAQLSDTHVAQAVDTGLF